MTRISSADHAAFVPSATAVDDVPSQATHQTRRDESPLAGLPPLRASTPSAADAAAHTMRGTIRSSGALARSDDSPFQKVLSFALPLIKRRMDDYRAALDTYRTTAPDSVFRINQHGAALLTQLSKAPQSLGLIRGKAKLGQAILNAAREDSAGGGRSAMRDLMSGFNRDLTVWGDGCNAVRNGVEKMTEAQHLLSPYVEATNGNANFPVTGSGLAEFRARTADVDRHMTDVRVAFDTVFDCIGRDMPSFRNARISDSVVDLEAGWKTTLTLTVSAHMPDLLTTQGVASMAHETLLHAGLDDLEHAYATFSNHTFGDVSSGKWHRVMDAETAGRVNELLTDSSRRGEEYINFAGRVDSSLRWFDSVREKPGVDDVIVLLAHCDLLEMSTRIDSKMMGVLDHARQFTGAFDLDAGKHDAHALEAFRDVSSHMTTRIGALRTNIAHCIHAFPNGDCAVYGRKTDALRRPVLDAVAQHCDEIETDLAWLRNSAKEGNTGLINPGEVERAYDRLQGAVSRIRRDLQWNIAVADAMKRLPEVAGSHQIRMTAPDDETVRQYLATHLKDVQMPAADVITIPHIDWDDKVDVTPIVTGRGKETKRQRAARLERSNNLQRAREANSQLDTTRLDGATSVIVSISRQPIDISAALEHADALADGARKEADANGLHLLSGNGILAKFMRAAKALSAERQSLLDRIGEIDGAVATVAELGDEEAATRHLKNMALTARETLKAQVESLSDKIDALRDEAITEQRRRNLKQFAQNPSRERFFWLLAHDRSSFVSARKTVDRRQLSGVAPNGVRRDHDDILDEYLITLRDAQDITYVDPETNTRRTAVVTTVPLHVHYRSVDAKRPAACHFKNEAQRFVGGSDAYRSDDSAALMADVLKSVADMAGA
ncbi:hypothetical protein KDW41_25035 [Burkholderia vietnamiensis]|nr:hypothetical protein [Burkholderia vietnamiensis]